MKIERVVRKIGDSKILHINSSEVIEIKAKKSDRWDPNFISYLEKYMNETGFELFALNEIRSPKDIFIDAILIKKN